MTELRQLTSARGIAAWLVVLYHIRGAIRGLPPAAEQLLAKGYLAVDFFFLLSGFVIWLTWHDRLRGGGWDMTLRYLQKRVARIWPLHLLMLAVATALALALIARGTPNPQFPLHELPLHILLIQNWGLTDHLSWNDPAWSISCELAAYLCFPLLVAVVDWRRLPTLALLAIAAAMLAALYVVMAREPTLGADIARFGIARCLTDFGVGTIVAALWLRGSVSGVIAGIAGAALLAGWAMGVPETLVLPAAFAALLLALARTSGMLRGAILHWVGEISYATYLSHFILWQVFKVLFVTDTTAVAPVMILFYLSLVAMASAVLYHGWERPAQRWLNRLSFRRSRSPVRSPAP